MFTKLLKSLPDQAFLLTFTDDKGWELSSHEQEPIPISKDSPLERRILHTQKWCLKHRRSHSFNHAIFPGDQADSTAPSRNFDMTYQGAGQLSMSISVSEPISSKLFNSEFESNIMDSMTDAILISEAEPFDRPGPRVIYANKTFEKMTGYRRDEIIGKTPRILQGTDTNQEDIRKIRTGLNQWEPVIQSVLNYKKDGTPFLVELHITPVKDETGWWTQWISIQRDITELQKTEDIATQKKLAVEASGIGTWIYNLETNEISWDERMFEIYELDVSKFGEEYQDWTKWLHPEDKDAAMQAVNDSVELMEPFDTEFRIITPLGNTKYIRAVADILPEKETGVQRMMGINWDVTEEREAQFEAEKQRRIATEKAKLASIGELAAGVGHEINNPLSIITLLLDVLRISTGDGKLDISKLTSSLDKIQDACDRIETIVNGLRSVSKIRKNSFDLTTLDLAYDIAETVSMLRELYEKEEVSLEFERPFEPCFVEADHSAIQQMLVNLVTNAKDSVVNQDNATIWIAIEDAEQYWTLSIEDNGEGIDKSIESRIFEPFVTSKEVGQGTGLGLSITKSLIESVNGRIHFENREEGGARFILEFPKSHSQVSNNDQLLDNPQKQLKVLVVEDDEMVRDSIQQILSMLDCEVLAVDSALAGIEQLQNDSGFELILSDVKMPKMSGLDFFDRLKTESIAPDAKKYLMTGDVTVLDEASLEEKGADGILSKPLKHKILLEVLNSIDG